MVCLFHFFDAIVALFEIVHWAHLTTPFVFDISRSFQTLHWIYCNFRDFSCNFPRFVQSTACDSFHYFGSFKKSSGRLLFALNMWTDEGNSSEHVLHLFHDISAILAQFLWNLTNNLAHDYFVCFSLWLICHKGSRSIYNRFRIIYLSHRVALLTNRAVESLV